MPLRYLFRPSVLAAVAVHAAAFLTVGFGVGSGRRAAELGGLPVIEATFVPSALQQDPTPPDPVLPPESIVEIDPPVTIETPPPPDREPLPPVADAPALAEAAPDPISIRTSGSVTDAPRVDARVRPRRTTSVQVPSAPGPASFASAAPSSGGVHVPARAAGTNVRPEYPSLALARRWQGRVVLDVSVRADGRVDAVSIARSSGYDVLDEAAVAAVRDWEFLPATVDGSPVGDRLLQGVTFRL
jgi:protein TonB